ncbi:MAG: MerR family transcriptional regulator [Candidatus Omnitrophota bacterium]
MKTSEISIEPKYSIGTAAEMLNMSVHSLRQYENEGLILTSKTATGRRLYSDLEIEKIRCIKEMIQVQGLNFEGIRRMLALIPCWKLRDCPKERKDACYPLKDKAHPCWSLEKECGHAMADCRECPVYREIAHCDDLKAVLFESLEHL